MALPLGLLGRVHSLQGELSVTDLGEIAWALAKLRIAPASSEKGAAPTFDKSGDGTTLAGDVSAAWAAADASIGARALALGAELDWQAVAHLQFWRRSREGGSYHPARGGDEPADHQSVLSLRDLRDLRGLLDEAALRSMREVRKERGALDDAATDALLAIDKPPWAEAHEHTTAHVVMETIRLFNTLTWPLVYGARCSCVLGHRQRLSDCSERFTLNSLDIIRFLIVHEGRMLAKQVGA